MLLYPTSMSQQQPILAPLTQIVSLYPCCEQFITFTNDVYAQIDNMSVGDLQNTVNISLSMQKVFDLPIRIRVAKRLQFAIPADAVYLRAQTGGEFRIR